MSLTGGDLTNVLTWLFIVGYLSCGVVILSFIFGDDDGGTEK